MRKIYPALIALLIIAAAAVYAFLHTNYSAAILMYHSIDKTKTKTYAAVSPESFYRQMSFIKNHGYKVIPLSEYCRILKENKPIEHKTVIITFDDGYKDNLIAAKILKKFDFPANIFLITNKIGKPGYLSKEDIKYIVSNTKITIGSHTNTHPDLSKLNEQSLNDEILGSKLNLEKLLDTKVNALAYPGGIFNEKAVKKAEDSGYICACTTNRGFSKKINRFSLRRIKATENDNSFSLWSKLSGFYNIFKKVKKPY